MSKAKRFRPATEQDATDDAAGSDGDEPNGASVAQVAVAQGNGVVGAGKDVDAGAQPATTCVNAATGQPCYPGDPDWPTRIGVRQLVQLGGRIVDDRECEHWDIPILHNVNIPFPTECPWGQGEPERLKSIQQARRG
jgi:hypothetical protein